MILIFNLINRTLWTLTIGLAVLGTLSFTSSAIAQPRSRGLPGGLLDQPFYGWVRHGP
ncbi:MAG TPA: hypothetical protein VHE60_08930 [Pyrinomonadaceae bacterium]|nr:hypothetical protein [Pyrinomonadaceae bacterium]